MSHVVKVDFWNPDPEIMNEAGRLIRAGELVAFPTETVYGLGGNAMDGEAVKRIYAAKGRPSDNPMILHFAQPQDVRKVAYVDERAQRLMDRFWPGPLTMVLKAKPNVPPEPRANLDTIGCRMPDYPAALAFFAACGVPVAGPSANKSGRPSCTTAEAVAREFGDEVAMVIDAGPCRVGVESTVADMTSEVPVLLRPGGMSLEDLQLFLGRVDLPVGMNQLKRSPGTRYRHYAPQSEMEVWDPTRPWTVDKPFVYVGVADPLSCPRRQIRFKDMNGYAHGLFSALRDLEKDGILIVAEWPAEIGIGRALRDRIGRAAGRAKELGQIGE